jgi:hypothetical protein
VQLRRCARWHRTGGGARASWRSVGGRGRGSAGVAAVNPADGREHRRRRAPCPAENIWPPCHAMACAWRNQASVQRCNGGVFPTALPQRLLRRCHATGRARDMAQQNAACCACKRTASNEKIATNRISSG